MRATRAASAVSTLPAVSTSNDPPPVRRAVLALLVGAVMGAAVAAVVPREIGAPHRGSASAPGSPRA